MQKRFFETNSNCRKAKVPLSEFDLYVSTTIQPDNDISDVLKRFSGSQDDDDDDYDYEDGKSMTCHQHSIYVSTNHGYKLPLLTNFGIITFIFNYGR